MKIPVADWLTITSFVNVIKAKHYALCLALQMASHHDIKWIIHSIL